MESNFSLQAHPGLVAIVMPVFNEADGIESFLLELNQIFTGELFHLVVVDDHSKDSTAAIIKDLARRFPITLAQRGYNLGHGPSTLEALQVGLSLSPSYVVSTDGDGQVLAQDLMNIYLSLRSGQASYVEGIRIRRREPWFRVLTSAITRVLVRIRSGKRVHDANTPFRGYRADLLRDLLAMLPVRAVTPNLLISVLVRRWNWNILEISIVSRNRRGDSESGTSWMQKNPSLPSKRFISFCWLAIREWVFLGRTQR